MGDEKNEQHLTMSIDAMLDISTNNLQCLREDSVSSEETESAMKLCSCCSEGRDGVKSSFKDCQLLGAGQAIDLHAARYCIGSASGDKATFVTELPTWAATTSSDEGLKWLN